MPKFAKRYADVAGLLGQAARAFADEVVAGQYPTPEYSYHSAGRPVPGGQDLAGYPDLSLTLTFR